MLTAREAYSLSAKAQERIGEEKARRAEEERKRLEGDALESVQKLLDTALAQAITAAANEGKDSLVWEGEFVDGNTPGGRVLRRLLRENGFETRETRAGYYSIEPKRARQSRVGHRGEETIVDEGADPPAPLLAISWGHQWALARLEDDLEGA